MKFLSVCSGIEAASVAWYPLGWEAVAISEIEKFPSQVVEHHHKHPNWGDMNDFKKWPDADFDVLVGGTPCQSFSVAGLRAGLEDPRGNLSLVYLAIADRYRPEWLVWENVPGVLSSEGGRDFGAIIGGMVELGYSPSWRVLNAQYFGVPQRRRRVFVVANLGDWRRSAAVLFESSSLRRNNPPSRPTGQGIAADIAPSLRASGVGLERAGDTRGQDPVVAAPPPGDKWPAETASTLNAAYGSKHGLEDQHALGGAALFVPANPEIVGALTAKGPEGLGAPEVDGNHYIVSSGQANASITKEVAPSLDCLHEAPILAGDDPTFVQDVADPLVAGEQKTYTHEGKNNFRTRNVTAFAPDTAAPLSAGSNPNSNIAGRRREDDDNLAVDPMPFDTTQITHKENRSNPQPGDPSPTLQVDARPPAIAFKPQTGPKAGSIAVSEETTPTLSSQDNPAVAFKPSHYTRDKDGAPSEIVPPLSADADKGDQDPVVFETRYVRNGRGAPSEDVVPPLKAQSGETGKGDAAPVVAHSIRTANTGANGKGVQEELVPALDLTSGPAVAFTASDRSNKAAWEKPYSPTIDAQTPNDTSNLQKGIRSGMIVRRLTPTECERLQGFPDGYTDIPGSSDSARYKALGNSMAVPVMRWLGERIQKVSDS